MRMVWVFGLLFMCGCSRFYMTESLVEMDDGRVYKILSQRDSHLVFKDSDVSIVVDNRGRPSLVEQAAGSTMLGISGLARKRVEERVGAGIGE